MQLTADSVQVKRFEDRWRAESMGFGVYFEGMRDLRKTIGSEVHYGHLPWAVGASMLAAAKERLDAEPAFAAVGDGMDCRFINWPQAIIGFTVCVYCAATLRVAAWLFGKFVELF